VGLVDAGHRVVVVADAAYTSREADHRHGLARMRDAGVEVHSSKGVAFEWFEDVETADAILRQAGPPLR
jgi:hypothetical protein